jgi:hypothetical protein
MNGSCQRRRHGKLLTEPKVIVMGADHDILGGRSRQVPDYVVDGLHRALHVHVLPHLDAGQREGTGFQIFVDLRRDFIQVFASACDPTLLLIVTPSIARTWNGRARPVTSSMMVSA